MLNSSSRNDSTNGRHGDPREDPLSCVCDLLSNIIVGFVFDESFRNISVV